MTIDERLITGLKNTFLWGTVPIWGPFVVAGWLFIAFLKWLLNSWVFRTEFDRWHWWFALWPVRLRYERTVSELVWLEWLLRRESYYGAGTQYKRPQPGEDCDPINKKEA